MPIPTIVCEALSYPSPILVETTTSTIGPGIEIKQGEMPTSVGKVRNESVLQR